MCDSLGYRLQPRDIEPKLRELIKITSLVEPALAARLKTVWRWVKDVNPGLMMRKKFLMAFLLELIKDVEAWLDLKVLSEEERQLVLDQVTPTVKYWYEVLFPKWFNQHDPKFDTWKRKLRAGEFNPEDKDILKSIASQIESSGGTVVQRYVIDLSMATDLVTSGHLVNPLCVQITSIADESSLRNKIDKWKKTLRDWEIERALFVSINPGKRDEGVKSAGNLIIFNSDRMLDKSLKEFMFN